MANDLRIVLDTNVFLVPLLPSTNTGGYSRDYFISVTLLVSNEILLEYAEKYIEKYGVSLANEHLDFLLEFNNVE